MRTILFATFGIVVAGLLVEVQLQTSVTPRESTMQPDVDRLVRAAGQLTGTWPSQPPPAIPEVTIVARHGKPVVPLLMVLLSDDPNAERDSKGWRVQQQAALTMSRIYSESPHCGRSYCDGDSPDQIAYVKAGWRRVVAADQELHALSSADLLDRFKTEKYFWQQFEVGRVIADRNDRAAIDGLEAWLTQDDRHVRGNVGFTLARLGDPRGFQTIEAILEDRSPRSEGQGTLGLRWNLEAQIRTDRYYAAHLLGDLEDPRGVDVLIPLLDDENVADIVPWSLARIGDRRAVRPLIEQLKRDVPSKRVLAIDALETLRAREALPRLRELLQDTRKSNFGGLLTVAEAARHAIAVISQAP